MKRKRERERVSFGDARIDIKQGAEIMAMTKDYQHARLLPEIGI